MDGSVKRNISWWHCFSISYFDDLKSLRSIMVDSSVWWRRSLVQISFGVTGKPSSPSSKWLPNSLPSMLYHRNSGFQKYPLPIAIRVFSGLVVHALDMTAIKLITIQILWPSLILWKVRGQVTKELHNHFACKFIATVSTPFDQMVTKYPCSWMLDWLSVQIC